MEAKDVEVGDKVFVEVERTGDDEGSIGSRFCHMEGDWAHTLHMSDNCQVFPGLLGLCKKLRDELVRVCGDELDDSVAAIDRVLDEADAILGLEKDEGG